MLVRFLRWIQRTLCRLTGCEWKEGPGRLFLQCINCRRVVSAVHRLRAGDGE